MRRPTKRSSGPGFTPLRSVNPGALTLSICANNRTYRSGRATLRFRNKGDCSSLAAPRWIAAGHFIDRQSLDQTAEWIWGARPVRRPHISKRIERSRRACASLRRSGPLIRYVGRRIQMTDKALLNRAAGFLRLSPFRLWTLYHSGLCFKRKNCFGAGIFRLILNTDFRRVLNRHNLTLNSGGEISLN